jgi:hypothetical protein
MLESVIKTNATTPAPTVKSTWESEHPTGKACEYNEDGERD